MMIAVQFHATHSVAVVYIEGHPYTHHSSMYSNDSDVSTRMYVLLVADTV